MFEKTFSPKGTPTRLYHYTNAHGLLGILKSKALWATDVHLLNDRWELTYGHDFIQRFLEERNTKLSGIFTDKMPPDKHEASLYSTCFCENGDLLSQWRGYSGKADGYSIAFDFDAIKATPNVILFKILYRADEQLRMIASYFEELEGVFTGMDLPTEQGTNLLRTALDTFWGLALRFKHPSFEEESEWRILAGAVSKFEENFRVSGGHVLPYVEIPYNPAGLTEVCQGPGAYRDSSRTALERCLKAANFPATRVLKSRIPL
jgi:Protein of unknown function (DUF2971)